MRASTLMIRQIGYVNRSFWRNPAAAFFTAIFPLMFLFIFNLLFGSETYDALGQETNLSNFFVPAIAAFSVITACYTNIAMSVVFLRDEGILKRLRGTPLPATSYLGARMLHACLIAVLLVVIVSLAGVVFYDVDVPDNTLLAFVVTLVVGAASFCALGLAMASFVPNAEAAPAVINGTIFPLLFISDVFTPSADAPEWLNRFADLFPIRHYAQAMLTAFNPYEKGSGFMWDDLAVVALWGVAGLLLALRFFSWEPKR